MQIRKQLVVLMQNHRFSSHFLRDPVCFRVEEKGCSNLVGDGSKVLEPGESLGVNDHQNIRIRSAKLKSGIPRILDETTSGEYKCKFMEGEIYSS